VYLQDTLFGYVRDNIKSYVAAHYDTDELKTDIEALKLQVGWK
jgi:methionine salvage enolase-phosphatase E1